MCKECRIKPPVVLPPRRPRTLTYPLRSPAPIPSQIKKTSRNPFSRTKSVSIYQATDDQQRSLLFRHLPLEIRQLIWQYVLSRGILHMKWMLNRVEARKCPKAKQYFSEITYPRQTSSTFHRMSIFGNFFSMPADCVHQAADLMPLLLTCRLIYSEAISSIYAGSEFGFDHIDALNFFPKIVLPNRLELVRSLHFTSTIWQLLPGGPSGTKPARPCEDKIWKDACGVLASMHGLRRIRILLKGEGNHDHQQWTRQLRDLLKPLYQVRQASDFTVIVELQHEMTVENAPFRLITLQQPR